MGWIYYDGARGSLAEEIQAVLAELSEINAQLVLGQIHTIMEAATLGLLEFENDVDMVSIDPDMWELRFRCGGKQYRLYIAEPQSHPTQLVALRFHQKDTTGSEDEIHTAQDYEIAEAALRFKGDQASNWGSGK